MSPSEPFRTRNHTLSSAVPEMFSLDRRAREVERSSKSRGNYVLRDYIVCAVGTLRVYEI